jgi:hypothetical protein
MKPAIPGRRPRGARAGFKPTHPGPVQERAYPGALRRPAGDARLPAAPDCSTPIDPA